MLGNIVVRHEFIEMSLLGVDNINMVACCIACFSFFHLQVEFRQFGIIFVVLLNRQIKYGGTEEHSRHTQHNIRILNG